MKDEAGAIKDWARALNLKERDTNQFIFSMKNVLSVDSSSDTVMDVEKLKKDFAKTEKKLRRALKKNTKLQGKIDEENKKKITVDKIFLNRFSSGIEEIKYNMSELNFEKFKETFIDKSWNSIEQIVFTEDKKYIFVCKFLSRL
ncbi:hypothetical protein SteCoe_40523 [Stentor coeruleus]|uniref:Uncharacterized protein n=1 Tax=Stentor coeruleus TaxID=5963 RepID=A0A1R2AKC8_9CILI|nr:hypothetical protein SteCoe_40523 [Stentor coeruleus]